MKKTIFAVLMAGLMIATVFSAISVSAASNNQQPVTESESYEIATLKVHAYYDKNENEEQDPDEPDAAYAFVKVWEGVEGLQLLIKKRKLTDDEGWATFHFLVRPYAHFETVHIYSIVVFTLDPLDLWSGGFCHLANGYLEIGPGETKIKHIDLTPCEIVQQPSAVNPSPSQQSTNTSTTTTGTSESTTSTTTHQSSATIR